MNKKMKARTNLHCCDDDFVSETSCSSCFLSACRRRQSGQWWIAQAKAEPKISSTSTCMWRTVSKLYIIWVMVGVQMQASSCDKTGKWRWHAKEKERRWSQLCPFSGSYAMCNKLLTSETRSCPSLERMSAFAQSWDFTWVTINSWEKEKLQTPQAVLI